MVMGDLDWLLHVGGGGDGVTLLIGTPVNSEVFVEGKYWYKYTFMNRSRPLCTLQIAVDF